MSDSPISEDIALRIGLAARVLPDTDAARLLRVLADAVGLPPTEDKLSGLKVKDLKQAADGEFSGIDVEALKEATAILRGETGLDIDPPPGFDAYAEGDMPGSIRVACASNSAEELDGHFGSARRFLVYQVSPTEVRLIDAREIDSSDAQEDKNAYRASLISDCQLLYVASIGGPAAAKVIKIGLHPVKDADGGSARERMNALRDILSDKIPPWLAKVMGHAPEDRIRFEQEEADS